MKKVFQFLNKAKPLEGDVGIEIECEGKNLGIVNDKYWKTEDDGSLRGHYPNERAEFVLKKPIGIEKVKEAVESLKEGLPEAKLNFSYRTSVHVHVNVQDLTNEELLNFMYIYLLLEEPLVNFCGRDRKGNRFCMRIQDAEGFVFTLARVFEGGIPVALNGFNENDIRYSSMNIASLRKYGSIEFRAMRGNMDSDLIESWAQTLVNLREFSKKFKSPKEIAQHYQKKEAKEFMQEAVGHTYNLLTYPRMVKEIQRSFSLSLDLPFCYKEYKEPEKAAPLEEDALDATFKEFNRWKMWTAHKFRDMRIKERKVDGVYIQMRWPEGRGDDWADAGWVMDDSPYYDFVNQWDARRLAREAGDGRVPIARPRAPRRPA